MSYETVARAEALLDAGRAHQAIELLSKELATAPDDVPMLRALARAQLDIDNRAALTSAQRLIALDPHSYEGHYYSALALDGLGQRKKSLAPAHAAARLAPDNPYVLGTLAIVTGRSGAHDEGRRLARRAVELAPNLSTGYFAAGLVEFHDQEWVRAANWFLRVLEIDPHHQSAQINLAKANEYAGHIAPALRVTDALLRFDPTDAHARTTLDEIIYSTLVNLLWILLALTFAVSMIRGIL